MRRLQAVQRVLRLELLLQQPVRVLDLPLNVQSKRRLRSELLEARVARELPQVPQQLLLGQTLRLQRVRRNNALRRKPLLNAVQLPRSRKEIPPHLLEKVLLER